MAALAAVPVSAWGQGEADRRLYLVPGIHYATPSRAAVAVTAFLDGRDGIVGKGHIVTLQGGRDAMKAQVGVADVTRIVGTGAQVGFLRTLKRPIGGPPNGSYAGGEVHLYLSVINFGVGVYAPVGRTNGRRALLHLGIGVGL